MFSSISSLIDQHWFSALNASLLSKRHRGVIVLQGELTWAKAIVQQYLSLLLTTEHQTIAYQVFSNFPDDNVTVNSQNYRHHLGTENRLVFFADADINIDALAALSGTVVAGGCLFIWRESEDIECAENSENISPFQQRFDRVLKEFSTGNVYTFNQFDMEQDRFYTLPELAISTIKTRKFNSNLENESLTLDQQNAVQAIKKVVTGHRNRPLVLTADRGRGKSSALAIACAELLKESTQKLSIVITAPSVLSLSIFFQQLKHSLPDAQLKKDVCQWQDHCIHFYPIDVLLRNKPTANLVLVDEAAGIPVYLLSSLLDNYRRLVFSSTVHGYEGAGRGFTIKFLQLLKTKYPEFQQATMDEPIRFANNDPLENVIAKLCLLDAELANLTATLPTELIDNFDDELLEQATFTVFSKHELINDERLLADVFAVLVTAHYQTKPSDLKMLLDNPQVSVAAMIWQEQVLAVALVIEEGDVPLQDIHGVKKAQRRLKNQFLPQSLTVHCGIDNAFDFKYLRIMRIAVHPNIQQKGLGQLFLQALASWATAQHADFLGTSFAANYEITKFWLQSDYRIARLGFTPDAASGEHSIMMLHALSDYANTLQSYCEQSFYRTFDYYLVDEYQQLSVALVALILAKCPTHCLPDKTQQDNANVLAFVQGQLQYSNCVFSLHLWLRHYLANRVIFLHDLQPLIARIMMKNSVESVCQTYGKQYELTGKKSLNSFIQNTIKQELSY